MKLPKSWQQISIGQFQQLQKLTEPTLDNQIKTLSILSGKTTDEIEDLPIVEMERQLNRLSFMSELPTAKNLTAFHCGNYVYRFAANQHQLTAGQFITVQDLFAGGNWIDNLHKIMAALCVPYRVFLPKRMELKAVDFDRTAELFQKKMPISLAYAYTLFFFDLLARITGGYPSIFGARGEGVEEDSRKRERAGLIWLKVVDTLSGGDRTKYDFFFDMSVVEFLNAYSLENEKARQRSERLNQAASDAKRAKDGNVYVIALLSEILNK